MAFSKVGIYNLGLSHIGQQAITSPAEGSVQSIAANRVWEYALKEALASYRWGFAKTIAALALSASYEPIEFAYAYAYPSMGVRVWSIFDEGTVDKNIGERFRKVYSPTDGVRYLETDVSDAYAEYTYYITDVTLFDPHFVTALSRRLAAELAVPLNGDSELAKEQLKVFNGLTSESHRFSEHERNEVHRGNESSPIIDARG